MICPIAVLAGCQAPTAQLKAFADATVELRAAIRAGGERTVAAMASAPYRDAQRQAIAPADPRHPANQFAALWRERTRATDGLVNYADALAGTAAAGDAAGADAAALGDAVAQLAALIPGAAGVPVTRGVSLAASIGAAAAQVRAATGLSDAVGRAHPAVEIIGGILRDDLADLQVQFRSASLALERSADAEYGSRNGYRAALLARRAALRNDVVATLASGNLASATAALTTVDALIAKTDADDAAYGTRIDALLAERRDVADLIAGASAGVATWVGAHHDLRAAVDQGREPNVRLILAKAQEIRTLIEAIKGRERMPADRK